MDTWSCLLLLPALLTALAHAQPAPAPAAQLAVNASTGAPYPQGTAAFDSGGPNSNGSSNGGNGSLIQLANNSMGLIGSSFDNPVWVAQAKAPPPPPVQRPTELVRAPTLTPAPNSTLLKYQSTLATLNNATFPCLNDQAVNHALYTLCQTGISFTGTTYCPYTCFRMISQIPGSCLAQIRSGTNATFVNELNAVYSFCGVTPNGAVKVFLKPLVTFFLVAVTLLLVFF